MDRRRELKEKYRQMKPAMGVFAIQSKLNQKYFLVGAVDLKGGINRALFQLKNGMFPNNELQRDWAKWGEDNFTVTIIDELPHTNDQTPQDDKDEVAELQSIWKEKLELEGAHLY